MKPSHLLLVVCSLLLAVGPLLGEDKDKKVKKDKKDATKVTLIGTWKAELDGKTLQLTFEKKSFTAITPEGKKVKGTWKTDDKQSPKHLDIKIEEGDDDVNGKTALSIYELDGDKLKWCSNDPKKGNARPTAFPAEQGGSEGNIYLILKRVKK